MTALNLLAVRAYPGCVLLAALLAAGVVGPGAAGAADAIRERLSFNAGWRFTKDDPADAGDSLEYAKIKPYLLPTGNDLLPPGGAGRASRPSDNPGEKVSYVQPTFDDSGWRRLDLPHDWGIEGPFEQEYDSGETGKLPWWGVGWYRKHFSVPAPDAGRAALPGRRRGDVLRDGVAERPIRRRLAVRLHLVPRGPDAATSSRRRQRPRHPPGQPARFVALVSRRRHLPQRLAGEDRARSTSRQWGTSVTTPQVSADAAATVNPSHAGERHGRRGAVRWTHLRLDADGAHPATAAGRGGEPRPAERSRRAGSATCKQSLASPTRGSGASRNPHRYVAVTDRGAGRPGRGPGRDALRHPHDRVRPRPGLPAQRRARADSTASATTTTSAPLGTAINARALERQLEILKEMGCNAIRTSHNPPAPELLDLCDRMGMLVMDEAFDCWATRQDAERLPPALPRLAREGPAGPGAPRPQSPVRRPLEHRQ